MCTKDCLVQSINDLRDHVWLQAIKYKYDPAMGPAHEKILHMLNETLENERLTREKAI